MEAGALRAYVQTQQVGRDSHARQGETGPWIPIAEALGPHPAPVRDPEQPVSKLPQLLMSVGLGLLGVLVALLAVLVYKSFSLSTDLAAIRAAALYRESHVQKWEYNVVYMSQSRERLGEDAMKAAFILPSDESLDKLGAAGWELAASYLEMETAFPNFGNEKYVAGIQQNVRPQRLVLVFRRPVLEFSASPAAPASSGVSVAPPKT
jgi:hypothetical protein